MNKKTKIYYNGNLIQPNQHTKWQRFKYRFNLWVEYLTLLYLRGMAVALVLIATFIAGQMSNPVHITAEQINMDKLPAKIEQKKNELVNEIARLESQNAKTEDGLIVFDDNKKGSLSKKDKASIGCMQFKVSTVQLYSKKLMDKTLNNYEATLLALDCDRAKELAKEIIFNGNGLSNWSVATKEMYTMVKFINELK